MTSLSPIPRMSPSPTENCGCERAKESVLPPAVTFLLRGSLLQRRPPYRWFPTLTDKQGHKSGQSRDLTGSPPVHRNAGRAWPITRHWLVMSNARLFVSPLFHQSSWKSEESQHFISGTRCPSAGVCWTGLSSVSQQQGWSDLMAAPRTPCTLQQDKAAKAQPRQGSFFSCFGGGGQERE